MASHFSILALRTPVNSMKRQKDRTLKDELPRLVGAQYATGDQWRNNSRENEETEPKQKQHSVIDVTAIRSKVWCCKEQYRIGTWNVLSMNQGKLKAVKQEMTRIWKYLALNSRILGISELKWTGKDSSTNVRTQDLIIFQINCMCGWFSMPTWLAHWVPKYLVKHSEFVCAGGFWRSLTFKWID